MIRFANYKCLSFSGSTLVLKENEAVPAYGPVYTFYDNKSNKWKIDKVIFSINSETLSIPTTITWFDIERRKSVKSCFRRKLYFLSKESLKSFLEKTEKDIFEDFRPHNIIPKEKRTIIYK